MEQIHESDTDIHRNSIFKYISCLDMFCSKFIQSIHESDLNLCDAIPFDLFEKSLDFHKIVVTDIFLNLLIFNKISVDCTFQDGKKQLESDSISGRYLSFFAKAEICITEDLWFQVKRLRARMQNNS